MKYEICYVNKADNNAQKLEIFSDFQKFRNRYIDLKSKRWFMVEGVYLLLDQIKMNYMKLYLLT